MDKIHIATHHLLPSQPTKLREKREEKIKISYRLPNLHTGGIIDFVVIDGNNLLNDIDQLLSDNGKMTQPTNLEELIDRELKFCREQALTSDGWKSNEKLLPLNVVECILEDIRKHLRSDGSSDELNKRDCDLANIFNTSKESESKGNLYMRIVDYLVKKGFLQGRDNQADGGKCKCKLCGGKLNKGKCRYPLCGNYESVAKRDE